MASGCKPKVYTAVTDAGHDREGDDDKTGAHAEADADGNDEDGDDEDGDAEDGGGEDGDDEDEGAADVDGNETVYTQ